MIVDPSKWDQERERERAFSDYGIASSLSTILAFKEEGLITIIRLLKKEELSQRQRHAQRRRRRRSGASAHIYCGNLK